jgi:hypothetical protein
MSSFNAVTHHNTAGSRYLEMRQEFMKLSTKVTRDGFAVTSKAVSSTVEVISAYHAPAHVAIESDIAGAKQTFEMYASPSRPGFCNDVARIVSDEIGLVFCSRGTMTLMHSTPLHFARLS